ncbi:MAG: GntR family transcriptional regulator [Bacteroidetes bacterium]|nr:MAG: GntR family transcriptional regulator [Bacteroidota bacterium]
MKQPNLISINMNLPVSKYRQIINSVVGAINEGKLKPGDKIPSINDVCNQWDLSRDTVINAYNELKSKGIISSAPGKGYYVETSNIKLTHNIFVLFDELNSFKEDLYQSFLDNLKPNMQVDTYFHHFNRKVFNQLINESKGNYTTYVIMPAKFTGTFSQLQHLNGRVIILDQLPDDLKGRYPSIHQNFEKDTFNALMEGRKLISRYQKFIMIYPGGKEPEGQYRGFLKYCNDTFTPYELIHDIRGRTINKGETYLVIWDRHLVWLVKEARAKGLELGKDIGIISYNDTALKEVVANGITTISTDFKKMGESLAQLVRNKNDQSIENPFKLILRGSL